MFAGEKDSCRKLFASTKHVVVTVTQLQEKLRQIVEQNPEAAEFPVVYLPDGNTCIEANLAILGEQDGADWIDSSVGGIPNSVRID